MYVNSTPFSSYESAYELYFIKLTRCNTFPSPQNEHAHAQLLQAHPRRRQFSQLRKDLFVLVYFSTSADI